MPISQIVKLGLADTVDEMIEKKYTALQIRDYLVTQGYDIKYSVVTHYCKRFNVGVDNGKKKSKTIDVDYIDEFPIINTVKLLGELDIPDILDTQEKAVIALQRAHIAITFDLWAIFTTYLSMLKKGEIKNFPTEIARAYFLSIKASQEILGIETLINENSALKTIESLGYVVSEKSSVEHQKPNLTKSE